MNLSSVRDQNIQRRRKGQPKRSEKVKAFYKDGFIRRRHSRSIIFVAFVGLLCCATIMSMIAYYNHMAPKENITAVQRARFYGLPQRRQNQGHNPSTWEALSTSDCDGQFAPKFLPLEEIQRLKLPQAILIGAQKAGTTAIYKYLEQHPEVEDTQKELYFFDETLDSILLKKQGGIPRRVGRNLYNQKIRDGIIQKHGKIKKGKPVDDGSKTHSSINESNKMVLDLTPNYMLHSDRVPARIQCLVPWVKILVLLRNPIERARSQYEMKLEIAKQQGPRNPYGKVFPTFDEYIHNDIAALREIGVIQDWDVISFETFWNSKECWKAWQTYIHSGLNAPVGMGFYALQLKPFLDLIPAMNMTERFLAIDSQALQENTDETFQRVLDFLGLKPMHLENYNSVNTGKHKHTLSKETLSLFLKAIQPYNDKLVDLLGEEWKDKWS